MSIASNLAETAEEVSVMFQRYDQALAGKNVAGMRTAALWRVVCVHVNLS